MYRLCDDCDRGYDDAKQWTICPHSPLGYAVDDLCPKCDTLKSVHGPCRHQQPSPLDTKLGSATKTPPSMYFLPEKVCAEVGGGYMLV